MQTELSEVVWSGTGIYDEIGNIHVPNAINDDALTILLDGTRFVDEDFFAGVLGEMDIADEPNGYVAKIIGYELKNSYLTEFDNLETMIDIGAHVGVVSVFFALKYPELTIYAYEPEPSNYGRLIRNINANGVADQVKPFNLAVTVDGRDVFMYGNISENSGGFGIYGVPNVYDLSCKSTTLKAIFEDNRIETCSLLKMDCEGAEYEILEAHGFLLNRCLAFTGELHHESSRGTEALLAKIEKSVHAVL